MDADTRLRVGRAIGKNEEEVSMSLMAQLKSRGDPDKPPAIATSSVGLISQIIPKLYILLRVNSAQCRQNHLGGRDMP